MRIYIIKWNFRFDNFIFIHHRLIQLVIYHLVCIFLSRHRPLAQSIQP